MTTIYGRWRLALSAWAVAGLVALASPAWADEGDPEPEHEKSSDKTVTVVVQQADAAQVGEGEEKEKEKEKEKGKGKGKGKEKTLQMVVGVDEIKPGKYWIGVVCAPLDNELVKAQLDLRNGLVVDDVVPDSPAHKAGLQQNDILIKVGEKPLDDLGVLVSSTEEAQANPLKLTIVRKGQQQEIEVTPAERPAKFSVTHVFRDSEAVDEWKMLQESLRHLGAVPKSEKDPPSEQNAIRMTYVLPGIIMPEQSGDFPKDLEVTITKKGKDTANVTVRRGDEQWDVDANSLDKLPDDVRPHIQRMLGQGMSFTVGGNFLPKPLALPHMIKKSLKVAPGDASKLLELSPEFQLELRAKLKDQLKDVDKKLDQARENVPAQALEQIQQELKSLREQLEQLRAQRAEETDESSPEEDK